MITPKPYELPMQPQFMSHAEKVQDFFQQRKKSYKDSKAGGEKLVVTDTSPLRLPTWRQFMAGEENMNERGITEKEQNQNFAN